MAEPTEHPGSVSSGVPAENVGYQPLSILSIAGFGVAAVYAVIVLVGFFSAIFFGSPWMMPIWTILIPLAAFTVSLAARSRIQRSEGTLAGLSLTKWGITLSVLSLLIFIAYTTATYIYLRNEAEKASRNWFAKVTDGKIEEAFRLTLHPANRPPEGSASQMREEIENRFNNPDQYTKKGYYNEFLQRDVVRFLLLGGPQTQIKLIGISNWEYMQGGYHVRTTYHITTPTVSFELVLPVYGLKVARKASQEREWQVLATNAQVREVMPTAEGTKFLMLQSQAQEFARSWVNLLRNRQVEAAYLSTREVGERKALDDTATRRVPALLLSATLVEDRLQRIVQDAASRMMMRELCWPGYKEFSEGSLLGDKADQIWCSVDAKPAVVLEEVRKLFKDPLAGLGPAMQVEEKPHLIPWKVEPGRLEFHEDVMITVPGKFLVDGVLVLECTDKQAEEAVARNEAVAWRVARLELVRARDIPTAPEQPGQPKPAPPRK